MSTNSIFIAQVAEAIGSPLRFHATETAQLQVTDVPLVTAAHVTRALRLRR
jgi:hypothetical protein